MAEAIESRVRECLRTITFPGMKRDIVSFGFVQRVGVSGGDVVVDLRVPTRDPDAAREIRRRIVDAVGSLDGRLERAGLAGGGDGARSGDGA